MTDDEIRGDREAAARIPLAAAVKALREQLLEAMRVGAEKDLKFALGPIEMEFDIVASWTGDVHAGVKFWVVDAGAKGTRASEATHRLKLTLQPVSVAGGDVSISDFVTGPMG